MFKITNLNSSAILALISLGALSGCKTIQSTNEASPRQSGSGQYAIENASMQDVERVLGFECSNSSPQNSGQSGYPLTYSINSDGHVEWSTVETTLDQYGITLSNEAWVP